MRTPFASTLLLAACTGVAPPPAITGSGMLSSDGAAPPGAATYDRPRWSLGDRMVFERGSRMRVELTVTEVAADGYTLSDAQGSRLRKSLDFADLGEYPAAVAPAGRVFEPQDHRYHWPLWVGKRWRCQYVDRMPDGRVLPIEAGYEVEDLDSVTTPAGTFLALRIRRVARLQLEGNYLDRTTFTWYAPELGLEVRQTIGDTLLELAAVAKTP